MHSIVWKLYSYIWADLGWDSWVVHPTSLTIIHCALCNLEGNPVQCPASHSNMEDPNSQVHFLTHIGEIQAYKPSLANIVHFYSPFQIFLLWKRLVCRELCRTEICPLFPSKNTQLYVHFFTTEWFSTFKLSIFYCNCSSVSLLVMPAPYRINFQCILTFLLPRPGAGALLSAHLPQDGACRLRGRIQHPHHFICGSDQQLWPWTRQSRSF